MSDSLLPGEMPNGSSVPDTVASFVTVSSEAKLSNSRHLAAGTGVTLTDGGAGGALTIAASGAGPHTHVESDITGLVADLALKAPLASPTFTGTVTIPAGASISGYQTTASAASTYAPLASPTFTGTVTIPAGASISGYLTTATAASTYAPLASPTFTGIPTGPSFTISNAAADSYSILKANAGQTRGILFQTGANARWQLFTTGSAESVGDLGSNFGLNAYSDAGTFLDSPLYIVRQAGGSIATPRPVSITSTTASTSTTTGALVCSGGIGLAGAVTAGSNIVAAGSIKSDYGFLGNTVPLNKAPFILSGGGSTYGKIGHATGSSKWSLGYGAAADNTYPTEVLTWSDAGVVQVLPTTASTSTSTGALVCSGGVGLAGNLYGGGIIQSGGGQLVSTGSAGANRGLYINTGGANRWAITGNTAAESGGSAGTNLEINAYGTTPGDGNYIDTPISITRAGTGSIALNRNVSIPASKGITIASGAPGTTANTLYQVGSALYWNGSAVGGGGGSGTVTSVSTAAANNGVSATWSMTSPTPALTIGLGDITPTGISINGAGLRNVSFTNTEIVLGSLYVSASASNTLNVNYDSATDTAAMWLNYRGYQDGASYFRDFNVANGKGTSIFNLVGSTQAASFTGRLKARFLDSYGGSGTCVTNLGSGTSTGWIATGVTMASGSWVHTNSTTSNSILMFETQFTGVAATWYRSNNGSASWNIANGVNLWNEYGTWIGSISVPASTGIGIASGAPGTTTNSLYQVSGTLYWNGSVVGGGSGTVTDDTTTNATYYPVVATATSGTLTAKVSSTKMTFNPSTGVMALGGTASSTSTTTGVLTLAGGLGVAENIQLGGSITRVTDSILKTANGAQWIQGSNSELLNIANSAMTVSTTQLLPANSIIESVVVRTVSTIPGCTSYSVGGGSTTRFCNNAVYGGAGTAYVCLDHLDTAGGAKQVSADYIIITPNAVSGTGGQVRITVFYRKFVAPTS